jgi:hypothetical protein
LFTKHVSSSSDYRDWRNWWIRRTELEKKKGFFFFITAEKKRRMYGFAIVIVITYSVIN